MSSKTRIPIPQVDLAAVLKQPNPHIDLGTQAYEKLTKDFLKSLAAWKTTAITSISQMRTNQESEKKKIQERTQQVETEINQCKLKEIELVAELEREKKERHDIELEVAHFQRDLSRLRDKCSTIDSDIEQYRAITENLRREKNKERTTLRKNASRVAPDLKFLEQALSFSIEGFETNRLLFRFGQLDPIDPEKEATLALDVSTRNYRVLASTPPLPSISILATSLNESGDIYLFIKQVREKYREMFQGPDT
ncbi:hypothetical protein FA15DRAFT_671939 [Coprinopsis marcescibilis]|uniref:Kinetochore protein SPC25 n=1 Tax=Coprinopsis marcescibilis TaxID=230819 RepID=A0A5C3KNH9_COPMA|nr:hypothetical protein FA15DRAFT_671939 [Coprinopsis marcescibilis]